MKRFYKIADVSARDGGFVVTLDGRPVRTPAGATLTLPAQGAARLLADEWAAQTETVAPLTMPLTRLVNVAIDRTPSLRNGVAEEIVRYGATDTICHLADEPDALRVRQEAQWTPLREWAAQGLDVRVTAVRGVLAADQPAESLDRLRALALDLDDLRLTMLAHGVASLGSAILGMALARGRLTADEAFALSSLEARFQAERWGQDAEAAAREARALADIRALGDLFAALR